jgi:chromosome segregation ATPase
MDWEMARHFTVEAGAKRKQAGISAFLFSPPSGPITGCRRRRGDGTTQPAQVVRMSARSKSEAAPADLLPDVTLEVRHAGGRPATYAVGQVAFVIGTVPGCDLRLSGTDLPALVCLLARHPGGLSLRKLALGLPLQVNGLAGMPAQLDTGDRLTIGVTEILVHIRPAVAPPSGAALELEQGRTQLQQAVTDFRGQLVRFQEEKEQLDRAHAARDAEQAEAYRQWEEQRAKLEADLRRREALLKEQEDALAARADDGQRHQQEMAGARQEMLDLRRQFNERYQERNDRLHRLQEENETTRQRLAEREQQLTLVEQHNGRLQQQLDARQVELDKRATQLADVARQLDDDHRRHADELAAERNDLAQRTSQLQERERELADRQREREAGMRQYEADVLRLDRERGDLEERQRHHRAAAAALAQQQAELQKHSAELEEQVAAVDGWRVRLTETEERLTKQEQEQTALAGKLVQRAASVEGQQATLAAMRTRHERLREDLRGREQQLDDQHATQQAEQQRLDQERHELDRRRAELDGDRQLSDTQRQQLVERTAILEAAVRQLREAQDRLTAEEQRQSQRAAELETQAAQVAEQDGLLQGRLAHFTEAQERIEAERQALRERSVALAKAEQAREALQEQLRRRAEELAGRQKSIDELIERQRTLTADFDQRQAHSQQENTDTAARLGALQVDLGQRSATLVKQEAALALQQEAHRTHAEQLAAEAHTLHEEQARLVQEQQQALDRLSRERAECEALRREAASLWDQLPEVELRVGTGLDRLSHAREQLRDHLAEVHQFVKQCQEELERLRGRVQLDVDRLGQEEQVLRQSQDEHRLAMVAFRQQLIEWQGQIGDMKRLLARDETRLERRQARVEEQVKEIDATSERLARQAEALEEQQRVVMDRRQEVDRHLVDMREWYRKKLRDLAGIPTDGSRIAQHGLQDHVAQRDGHTPPDTDEDALIPENPGILTIASAVDAGDQALGETLRALQLIDDDTLTALLAEARRQRRSLRQVLLSSGAVTLYQLALIEAGNVDGLMLGPVRVIDRLRSTPLEAVYRVFDPRRGIEAQLRHLAEAAMHDAVRPDEFRQRFGQAVLSDPNLAAVLEVLDINGRPAALEEWLTGLNAADWPPLAAAPGVCYRLLTQAAHGMHAAHRAGLVHGHLSDALVLLSGEGVLKICGLGEPPWLTGQTEDAADTHRDLRALGAIVSGWCTPSGVRRGARAKPLPEPLVSILFRLNADGEAGYPSTTELRADLEQAAASIPANAEAWERLLRYVREHGTPDAALRRSA